MDFPILFMCLLCGGDCKSTNAHLEFCLYVTQKLIRILFIKYMHNENIQQNEFTKLLTKFIYARLTINIKVGQTRWTQWPSECVYECVCARVLCYTDKNDLFQTKSYIKHKKQHCSIFISFRFKKHTIRSVHMCSFSEFFPHH